MRGLLVALVLATASFAADPPIPQPQGFVTDLAGVLPPATRVRITRTIEELRAKTGAEIAVLTVPTTEPLDDFTYAMRVADAWKIGRKGEDTGVLVLVATQDRKLRILTGYGVEGILPDGLVGAIQDREMLPAFRAGRYDEGIERGVTALAQRIAAGREGIPAPERGVAIPPWALLLLLLLVFLFLVWLSSQSRGGPGDRYWGGPRRRVPGGFGGYPGGFGDGFPGGFGGGGGGFDGFGGGGFGGGGAGRSW